MYMYRYGLWWRWGIKKETLFMVIFMPIPSKEYEEPWHENPQDGI
jgi:hypothetical protein